MIDPNSLSPVVRSVVKSANATPVERYHGTHANLAAEHASDYEEAASNLRRRGLHNAARAVSDKARRHRIAYSVNARLAGHDYQPAIGHDKGKASRIEKEHEHLG